MRMSKVAKMVGISRRTIYNWIAHESLSHLFSQDAKREGERELNERDVFVINTIHHLRQHVTTDWDEVAQKIEDGYLVTDLSIGATDVDTGKTPIQQFTRTITIAQERDAALKQLEEAQIELKAMEESHEAEIERLRQEHREQLQEERDRGLERYESERERSDQRTDRLMREIAELKYEIGKLEERNAERKRSDDTD